MHVRHVHVQMSAGGVQVIIMVSCSLRVFLESQTIQQRTMVMTCKEEAVNLTHGTLDGAYSSR